MPKVLYKRQKQILDFIRKNVEKYGTAPSLSEIAHCLGLKSLSTVHEHLEALEKKGFIRRFRGAVRGIEILEEGTALGTGLVELPVLGFIAAGEPIEPYTDPGARVQVNSNLVSARSESYVLQVKGNSMIDEGILNGDYVVIKKQETANDGDIVVALLKNGFATLKRIFWEPEKKRIRLQPANINLQPIYVDQVRIQGKVTGVVRHFN